MHRLDRATAVHEHIFIAAFLCYRERAPALEYKTGGPSLLSHLYTSELLREEFASTGIIELREYEAELTEGTRHRGRSALIGMVVRRR